MRKYLIGLVTASAFMLSGCGTLGQDPAAILLKIEQQIQAYAVAACRFEPTLTSIASVISAFYPGANVGVDAIKVVGDAICKSVPNMGAMAPVTAAQFATGGVLVINVRTPRGTVQVRGVSR